MAGPLEILGGAGFTLAACWGLGRLLWRGRPPAESLAIASGAAVLSFLIFLSLIFRVAGMELFAVLGVVCAAPLVWFRPRLKWEKPREIEIALGAALAVYFAFEFVHAMAPEVMPDGVTYHLGLPVEWLRLGHFPKRIGFYEMLPQGLEMLFGFAFAFGRHSAAKLVHFAFLVLTLPLGLFAARLLEIPRTAAMAGLMFYLCSPVAGISGSSAYNDAALVFFLLGAFTLMVLWWRERATLVLAHAGLLAGFCYGIKMTGGIAVVAVVAVALAGRAWKAVAAAAGAACIGVLPWVGRAWWLTGNPVAPLLNRWFPNPWFHQSTEEHLARYLRSYEGVTWANVPYVLALDGQRLQGLIGPALFLTPLALLALRKRSGRRLLGSAALAAAPWVLNIGARFFMPAWIFLSLALAVALPLRVCVGAALLQALLCFPPVLDLYVSPGAWRLHGWPWQAALRVEPETQYLRQTHWEYGVSELLQKSVRPDDKVLGLFPVSTAYSPTVPWGPLPNAESENASAALTLAATAEPKDFVEMRSDWVEQSLKRVRLRLKRAPERVWSLTEVNLWRGKERVEPSPKWTMDAWPNPWETPLALDGQLATRWQPWQDATPGMYYDVVFDGPISLTGATAAMLSSEGPPSIEVYGQDASGAWKRFPAEESSKSVEGIKRQAMRYLKRRGYHWIIVQGGAAGNGLVAQKMLERPDLWGVQLAGQYANVYLFKIR
jgi:hypothetical protein